jgi:hypothetical protein
LLQQVPYACDFFLLAFLLVEEQNQRQSHLLHSEGERNNVCMKGLSTAQPVSADSVMLAASNYYLPAANSLSSFFFVRFSFF